MTQQLLDRIEQDWGQEHPEKFSDEVLVGNFSFKDILSIEWRTKRRGKVALDREERKVVFFPFPPLYPVFVKKWEIIEKRSI